MQVNTTHFRASHRVPRAALCRPLAQSLPCLLLWLALSAPARASCSFDIAGAVVDPDLGSAVLFGNQPLETTGHRLITINNRGTVDLIITGVRIAGTDAGDFAISGNLCGTLTPNSSCSLDLTFTPTRSGARTATLFYKFQCGPGAPATELTLTLAGTGIGPAVSLNPTAVFFGDQKVGTVSAPQTLTITNTGNAPLAILSISLGGADADEFGIVSSDCSTLEPDTSCTIQVRFTPLAAGRRTAFLAIGSDAPASPHIVALEGAGTAADLAVSMTTSASAVKSKDELTFTIVVTNQGPNRATDVRLTDSLPAGCTVLSASSSQGWLIVPVFGHTGPVTAGLGTLEPGASATVTIGVGFTVKKTTLSNTASVTTTSADLDPANNSATATVAVK